jgi:hypothetical protein
MPRWLAEGLAQYFEHYTADRLGGLSPHRVEAALNAGAIDPRAVYESSGDAFRGGDNDRYYAVAAAMTAMLIETQPRAFGAYLADRRWEANLTYKKFESSFGENYNLASELTLYLKGKHDGS